MNVLPFLRIGSGGRQNCRLRKMDSVVLIPGIVDVHARRTGAFGRLGELAGTGIDVREDKAG